MRNHSNVPGCTIKKFGPFTKFSYKINGKVACATFSLKEVQEIGKYWIIGGDTAFCQVTNFEEDKWEASHVTLLPAYYNEASERVSFQQYSSGAFYNYDIDGNCKITREY